MDKTPAEATVRAWARLLRAQTLLVERVDGALKAAGLPPLAWYDVLLELGRDAAGGLRQFEIGERVLLAKHNLSRLIDRLQAQGLVERRACPEDGRGNVVFITAAGQALRARMWPVYRAQIAEAFEARLSAAQIAALDDIMGCLLAGRR